MPRNALPSRSAGWPPALLLLGLLFPAVTHAQKPGSGEETFRRVIRPILSEHCFACHGPDAAKRKGDLRLDTRAGALGSGVIVAGKASESALIERIMSNDPDEQMPPPGFRKPLSREQKQQLRKWIDGGASWAEHWAFVRPVRFPLPQPPGVADWARNPVDHFILHKLHERGLKPNPEADRYTLARRVALDITGLPPDRAHVDQFVKDRRPGAYERYVEQLLLSPHAGEHRARYWLDAARYGDTHGMHVDNYREIWPYRDWVVNAFNANMPFDQFVVEQIAGDLLPRANLQQRIATGFSRCNITTSEGGAIPEELNVRYMVDRVETTATVFLGLTAGCAVCHDHKYDPLSQREFYQLGAFFNNTTQPAMDGNQKDTPPVVVLPASEYRAEWLTLQKERAKLRARLTPSPKQTAAWWKKHPAASEDPIASDGLLLRLPLTNDEEPKVALPEGARWADKHPAGKRGIRFGDRGLERPLARRRSDQPLTVSFWFRTPDRVSSTTMFEQVAKTKKKQTIGWKITCNTQGALIFEMYDGTGSKIRGLLPDNQALRPRSWQHVCVRYSGGQANSSISILADGVAANLRNSSEGYIAAADLAEAPLKIAGRMPTAGLSDVRIYDRWLSDGEVRLLADEHRLRSLLDSKKSWKQLTAAERSRADTYRRLVADAELREASRQDCRLQKRRDFIYSKSTTTLVMQEKPTPPRAYVLIRGDYTQRGPQVKPDVPGVLPPLPKGSARNRLGLAKWLVDPRNPLTARVTVNRLWQSVFGVGLVKTAEDFGVMGERPSHPELLDYLAVDFIESGWDVRRMMRMLVTSSTYRQSSRWDAARRKLDPQNRFLSRGPRLRLDAEVLRDQALAVGGLLQRKPGGPSVRPYQPAGLWKVVAITGSNTRVYQRDRGEKLYRRSLYTFWKRTSPPPTMAAFNAPTREQCTVRRERTNTPLQALILMNDPQYVEAARHLAQAALRQTDDLKQRAQWIVRAALAKPATPADLKDVLDAARGFADFYKQSPQEAQKLIKIGDSPPDAKLDATELATWTMIANVLMNRDDFLNK